MKKIIQKKTKYVCLLFLLLLTTAASWAQVNVKGKITDEKGAGISGVTIILKGSNQGTGTDAEGNFSLNVPSGKGTLLVSSIGYLTQEMPLNNRTTLNITLVSDVKSLENVVVVGYGTQQKKAVTGAVQTITSKEFKDIPVSQVTQKLQGRLAGVQINQTTGKPGQGMSVRIRGQLSVSAGSDPLYVVDGFPLTGNISTQNPDEIESISILKDAASTSLYGSRAANGVVIITTQRPAVARSPDRPEAALKTRRQQTAPLKNTRLNAKHPDAVNPPRTAPD